MCRKHCCVRHVADTITSSLHDEVLCLQPRRLQQGTSYDTFSIQPPVSFTNFASQSCLIDSQCLCCKLPGPLCICFATCLSCIPSARPWCKLLAKSSLSAFTLAQLWSLALRALWLKLASEEPMDFPLVHLEPYVLCLAYLLLSRQMHNYR